MTNKSSELLTHEQVKAWLLEHGLTHAEVAKRLNANRETVRNIIYGSNKGSYGEGHRIAVALRLKKRPESEPPPIIPVPASAAGGAGKPTPRRRAADKAESADAQR